MLSTKSEVSYTLMAEYVSTPVNVAYECCLQLLVSSNEVLRHHQDEKHLEREVSLFSCLSFLAQKF